MPCDISSSKLFIDDVQEENQFLLASFSQLKMARGKFVESRECLKVLCALCACGRHISSNPQFSQTLTPENVGTPVMVPITASLYVKVNMM